MPEAIFSHAAGGPIPDLDFEDIFNNAPIGIFTSTPEGRYISANPALAGMLGYESPQELIASITNIATQVYVDPADREAFMRLMQKYDQVVDSECRFKRRDGVEFRVSRNVRAIRGKMGTPLIFLYSVVDITRLKQMEAPLATATPSKPQVSGDST